MRELVERRLDGDRGRQVTVNLAESALGWLASRGMVSPRQLEAGERLRIDWETAQLGPRVTMRWAPRVDGGAAGLDATTAQLAARRRVTGATGAVGPGLDDVLWRVVCADERLPGVERTLGWPARAGRVVLGLALDRLADHYGLR